MDALNFHKIWQDNKEWEQIDNRDIYIIKDFLNTEEISTIYNILTNLSTEDFYNSYINNQIKAQALDRFGTDDLQQLVDDGVIKSLEEEFNFYWADKVCFLNHFNEEIAHTITARLVSYLKEPYYIQGFSTVQRHGKDQFLTYHADNVYEKDLKFAVALYINDNFEGGELHFPPDSDLEKDYQDDWILNTKEINGLVIKPKAGNLVIFSTASDYIHGVRPVTSDDYRYAIVAFIR